MLLSTGIRSTTVIFGDDDEQEETPKINHQKLERGPRNLI